MPLLRSVALFVLAAHVGRILAAYGGFFVAVSLGWGMIVDRFRPDRYDVIGAALYLTGVMVIRYAPQGRVTISRRGPVPTD